MKSKVYLAMFASILFFSVTSCSDESLTEPTLEERVNQAKIIPGKVPINRNQENSIFQIPAGSHLYIPIPTKAGYLTFELESKEEKLTILDLVIKRFPKEFNANTISNRAPDCDDWEPIDASDPNSGVQRHCGYTFSFWIETCSCGYCC